MKSYKRMNNLIEMLKKDYEEEFRNDMTLEFIDCFLDVMSILWSDPAVSYVIDTVQKIMEYKSYSIGQNKLKYYTTKQRDYIKCIEEIMEASKGDEV